MLDKIRPYMYFRTNFSDAAYFYVLTSRSVVRVSGHDREPCKMDELIGMRFDDRAGPENHVLNGGCTLAPPGKYN